MDIEIQSIVTLSSIIFFTIFIVHKLLTKSSNPNSKKRLPPSPPKLPIIGNMLNLMGSLPHRTLHTLSLKYGPVVFLKLGELPVVVISSAEAATQVMKTHDVNFSSRPTYLSADVLSYNYSNVGSAPYGEYWRQLRKFYTVELLSVKRVQSFRSIREEVFSDLIRWIASKEGSVINLTEKLFAATSDVVSRAAFGGKDSEREKLLRLMKEAFVLGTGFGLNDMFPSNKWLQFANVKRRKLENLHVEIDRILEDIIAQHRTVDENEQALLVDLLVNQDRDGVELRLTNDNIKSVLMEIIAGGTDTSSSNLTWAFAETLRNPRILKKAQEEVRRIFDPKGFVDESKLNELSYLKAIVKETLRMHVSLLAPRKCAEPCEIDGYLIPANATVMVNAWAIDRDPKHWGEDADVFKPERFLDNPLDYKGNSFEYIPFGSGRRMCPGISFGLSNLELPLAMLLYHFDWDMPNGLKHEDLDMTEKFSTTVGMKSDLLLVPKATRGLPTTK